MCVHREHGHQGHSVSDNVMKGLLRFEVRDVEWNGVFGVHGALGDLR